MLKDYYIPSLWQSVWNHLKSESESCPAVSNSLWTHGLYSPWHSPDQDTGVGSFFLLQGIFPTQGSDPGLPNCRQILYQLSHKGSPRILEWVAYPFSSGSSQPRNWTRVSFAGGFLPNWAMRQAPILYLKSFWNPNPFHKLRTSQVITNNFTRMLSWWPF